MLPMKETGIGKGVYAQVKSIDAPKNRLTVELQDGTERTYDPRRQQGVSVFREEMRNFSVGDRIQFTAPANELKVANRELGTIESMDEDGRLRLKMAGGRAVELDPRKHPHLDHGYAMTSHSSQGQTADRVLIHVDTELGAKDLLNSRMAYVSVSRGAHDAQLFTNDAEKLPAALGHDVSQQSAGANPVKVDLKVAATRARTLTGFARPAPKSCLHSEAGSKDIPTSYRTAPQFARRACFQWLSCGTFPAQQHRFGGDVSLPPPDAEGGALLTLEVTAQYPAKQTRIGLRIAPLHVWKIAEAS